MIRRALPALLVLLALGATMASASGGATMDDLLARLERLERRDVLTREQLTRMTQEAARGRRAAESAEAGAWMRRLDPGSLAGVVASRGGSDRIPDLGQPLLSRLRDDSSMTGVTAGRTDTTDGYANMLDDPTFDTATGTVVTIGTAYTAVGPEWEAKYVLNSGTVASPRYASRPTGRKDAEYSYGSSGRFEIGLTFGVNASDMTIYLRPTSTSSATQTLPSWLVASIRTWLYDGGGTLPGTATAYLEIVDGADNVLASGDPEDLNNLMTLAAQSRLEVAYESPALSTAYRFRVRIDVTKTAGAAASLYVDLSEPLLAFSDDGSVPMFTPAVGAWWPGVPGRQLLAIPTVTTNVPAGIGTTLDVADTATGNGSIRMPWAGSVVGLSWRFNAAITAGSYDIEALVNGSAVFGPTGELDQAGQATQEPFIDTFAAQGTIGARVTTSGAFAPTTADLVVFVWVLLDYSGI